MRNDLLIMVNLEDFTCCSWDIPGLEREPLASLTGRIVAAHSDHGIVQTCQRIEVFGTDPCSCDGRRRVGREALEHLAALAAGMESAVLGEAQVLGQVRTGVGVLRRSVPWIDIALTAARKLRAEAGFQDSTGALLKLGLRLSGVAPSGTLLVLGGGAAGRDVARNGVGLGFERVVIASRRPLEHPVSRVHWLPLPQIAALEGVRVVAGCLGAGADTLEPRALPVAESYLDLATPANFGAAVQPRVSLADITANLRSDSADRARREALMRRLKELLAVRLAAVGEDAVSPVGMLRVSAERVRRREAHRIARLHPELSPETIDTITRALVNQLLHPASVRLRELDEPVARQFARLFAPVEATS